MGAALILLLVGLGAMAAGVLIGRYYVPDDRQLRRTARHSRAYMRALSHLLARDHDTVVDELRSVVEENVEDVEPYFALGAVFRSRGEHERAIRVHQALALRERERRKLRQRAMYELGLDFRAAGMPRRATRAMEEVLLEEPGHEAALRALAALYEEQARFNEAAELWQRLSRRRGENTSHREHHLLVAAAQTALGRDDLDSARQLLKAAQKLEESAHFFAAAAELAAARNNHRGAKERLTQALIAEPGLAPHLLPGLIAAEQGLAADEAGDRGAGSDDLDDAALESSELSAAQAAQLTAGSPLALPASTAAGTAASSPAAAAASAAAGTAASGAAGTAASSPAAAAASGARAPTPVALAAVEVPAPAGPSAASVSARASPPSASGAGSGSDTSGAVPGTGVGPDRMSGSSAESGMHSATGPSTGAPSQRASSSSQEADVLSAAPDLEASAPARWSRTVELPALASAGGTPVSGSRTGEPPSPPGVRHHSHHRLIAYANEDKETLSATVADRVIAVLVEIEAQTGPRIELALIRAQLMPATAAARVELANELMARFPEALAARVAAARLALADDDPRAIRGALEGLVSDGGAVAWALRGRWQCAHCGHRPGPFSWRCGQCRRWNTLRMETGIEPPPVAPRERRAASRVGRPDGLLGASPAEALPAATLDPGLSDAELASGGSRRSLLGRVGGWVSGLWRRDA